MTSGGMTWEALLPSPMFMTVGIGSTFSSVAVKIAEFAKRGRGKGPGDTPCGTAAQDPNKFC